MANVLIVDDDPAVRKMLQEVLALEGYYTDIASDGAEALIFLRSEERSSACFVVLLDILMPQLDGIGFLEEAVKDDQVWPRIRCVIHSAFATMKETVAKINQTVEGSVVGSVVERQLELPVTTTRTAGGCSA